VADLLMSAAEALKLSSTDGEAAARKEVLSCLILFMLFIAQSSLIHDQWIIKRIQNCITS
jgi:hypothetical protein